MATILLVRNTSVFVLELRVNNIGDADGDNDSEDDGDNNDDVPVVETHTADAACLVHVQ